MFDHAVVSQLLLRKFPKRFIIFRFICQSTRSEIGVLLLLTGQGVGGNFTFFSLVTSATLNSINVMKNLIGDDGLAALMTAVKGTNIKSITGIVEGQKSIDWSGQNLKPFDMKILAADIEFTPFRASLNSITVSSTGSEHDSYDKGSGPRTYTL